MVENDVKGNDFNVEHNINDCQICTKLKQADDDFANQTLCQQCAAEGGGCCTGDGSGIFVTLHDVIKISKETGMALDEIAYFEKVSEEHRKNVEHGDPFFYKHFRNGKVLQLKRKDGHCKFLKDIEGCIIFDYRPIICRLFPFSFDFKQDGAIKITLPKAHKRKFEHCSILYENYYRSFGANLRAMNTTKDKLLILVEKHVHDLKHYDQYVEDLVQGMSLEEIAKKHGFI
ncbi:YkgJ family cysteine cluster protein [archaeon]|jgi:Fe-S-cluster containining protein|nr:YkgJ family cysteine cluster protein [archaeon]MBT3450560.1 YkgJ family cysteine cluster protein [archaeon]MBT6868414.1 YkgJ family cysteine cluster protein [archaeon]MBT7193513.1 YkgJ family cysteine cluster protein [archaeon]MBT7381292.1 YkgJ family cysteine cluster protein [archaeon]